MLASSATRSKAAGRNMRWRRIGVIDVGSNSVRLVVHDVRGRAIQIGPALDTMLARHDYPPPVSKLLGEAIVLAVLLGSSLKFDGKFTLQAETDGPVPAGSVLLGSADQTGNEIDEFVTETLRNNLLGLPLDLPSINMARARDAGVPSLNETRRQLFAETNDGAMAPYTSWKPFRAIVSQWLAGTPLPMIRPVTEGNW